MTTKTKTERIRDLNDDLLKHPFDSLGRAPMIDAPIEARLTSGHP